MYGTVIVLEDGTKSIYGIDPSNLDSTSSTPVLVQCRRCGEIFSRAFCKVKGIGHECVEPYDFNGPGMETESPGVPRLECKLVHPLAKLPFKKRADDAGYDIAAIHDATVPAHGCANVDTGIIIVAPPGWYIKILGRSSMAMKGVTPFIATIDACYHGSMMVALMNVSDSQYMVKTGDRIAQIMLKRTQDFDLVQVNEFSSRYHGRGLEGFGSTGR